MDREQLYQQYLADQAAPTLDRDAEYQAYLQSQGTGMIPGVAGSLISGATAEWGDELVTAPLMTGAAYLMGDQMPGGGWKGVTNTYNTIKDTLRNRQKSFEKDNPGIATGAKIVGGVVPISKGLQAGGLVKTALVGGGYGAAEYAGSLDDWSDADIVNALISTGLGAAVPVGMETSGAAIRQWLANRSKNEVDRVLNELIKSTGSSRQQLQTNAQSMGPESSLVDVSGAPGINSAQAAVTVGGPAAANIAERNLGKIHQAKDRLGNTIEGATGVPTDSYVDSFNVLKQNRRDAADANYGSAMQETIAPTPTMIDILENNPTVKQAWKDVQKTYERRGLPLPQMGDGQFPNMKAIQELKWEMDDSLRTLGKTVDKSGKQEFRRSTRDYNDYIGEVNAQNPLFQRANRAYAGDSKMLDAQELGYKNGLGSEFVEKEIDAIKKLTRPEKEAYLQGAISRMYGKLGTTSEDVLGNVNRLASQNSYKAIKELAGADKAKKIMDQIRTEKRYREVESKVMQGSQTQPRQAATNELEAKTKSIPLSELINPLEKRNMINKISEKIKVFSPKISNEQVVEITDLITKPGGVDAVMDRLQQSGMSPGDARGVVQSILSSAATGAAVLDKEYSLGTE